MNRNERNISRISLEIVAIVWLGIEIGQFIQSHSSLGQNELFWLLWFFFSVAVILGIKLIDLYVNL